MFTDRSVSDFTDKRRPARWNWPTWGCSPSTGRARPALRSARRSRGHQRQAGPAERRAARQMRPPRPPGLPFTVDRYWDLRTQASATRVWGSDAHHAGRALPFLCDHASRRSMELSVFRWTLIFGSLLLGFRRLRLGVTHWSSMFVVEDSVHFAGELLPVERQPALHLHEVGHDGFRPRASWPVPARPRTHPRQSRGPARAAVALARWPVPCPSDCARTAAFRLSRAFSSRPPDGASEGPPGLSASGGASACGATRRASACCAVACGVRVPNPSHCPRPGPSAPTRALVLPPTPESTTAAVTAIARTGGQVRVEARARPRAGNREASTPRPAWGRLAGLAGVRRPPRGAPCLPTRRSYCDHRWAGTWVRVKERTVAGERQHRLRPSER
jgi:hypothetical protein